MMVFVEGSDLSIHMNCWGNCRCRGPKSGSNRTRELAIQILIYGMSHIYKLAIQTMLAQDRPTIMQEESIHQVYVEVPPTWYMNLPCLNNFSLG